MGCYLNNKKVGNSLASIGVEFYSKFYKINNQKLKITFTDTAGQERFDAINKNYVVKADGVFLVYDITNQESFDKIDSWASTIHEYAGEVELMLLGNKCDLPDSERAISREEGEEKAKELGCAFYETSALTGDNVTEAFEGMVNIIANSEKLKKKSRNSNIKDSDLRKKAKKKSKKEKSNCCNNKKNSEK